MPALLHFAPVGRTEAAGFSAEEASNYEKFSDHTAAAADRLPFPNHQASGLRCHFYGQRNAFRHPLCGVKLSFKPFESADWAIECNRTVQPVIKDFGDLTEWEQWRARRFPLKLLEEIDEKEDRIVAYKIDARCAKETLTAGTMVCSEKVVCYVV